MGGEFSNGVENVLIPDIAILFPGYAKYVSGIYFRSSIFNIYRLCKRVIKIEEKNDGLILYVSNYSASCNFSSV